MIIGSKFYLSMLFVLIFTSTENQIFACDKNRDVSFMLNETKNEKGSLTLNFLNQLHDLFQAENFVETGTFLGGTSVNAAQVFNQVITIELSNSIYEKAKQNLQKFANAKPFLGESYQILKDVLPNLKGKTIFWLDGHYSGQVFFGLPTALGKKSCPLIDELVAIKNFGHKEDIILIDDIRLMDHDIDLEVFKKANFTEADLVLGGYPTLREVYSHLMAINDQYEIAIIGDIIAAYPPNAVKRSSVMEGCTISRLFDEKMFDYKTTLGAEKKILKANDIEKRFLKALYDEFGSGDLNAKSGIGRHYMLWKALILMGEKEYSEAEKLLKILTNWPKCHWRVKWYLAKVLLYRNDREQSLLLLKEIVKLQPNFEKAVILLEKIENAQY